MISFDNIKIYLPKYLSTESEKKLFEEIKQFPDNIDQRFYTDFLMREETIFQGDGLSDLLVVDMKNNRIDKAPSLVLSNSCDISLENKRYFPAQICYAPIFKLSKYQKFLMEIVGVEPAKVVEHLSVLRKQYYTQIFYLPKGRLLDEESIVFLDRINHCSNKIIPRETLQDLRLFTLSNYGFYVFLIKLSIHFTRMRDSVDRC